MTEVTELRTQPVQVHATDDNPFFLLVVEEKTATVIGSITMDSGETFFRANYHPERKRRTADLGQHTDMYMAYWVIKTYHLGKENGTQN